MGFKLNSDSQMSIFDRFLTMTEREQRIILKSWAKDFFDNVFPYINEERFSVLYCNDNGRPNTPINVIIGMLIIKTMFGDTDEELVESCITDTRYQYALGLTSFKEIPISDRTPSRFRERLYQYELETGIDLLKEEMKSLANHFADFLNIKPKAYRMDSLMVDSHCKNMGRLELICTVTQNLVKQFVEIEGEEKLAEELKIYLNQDNKNSITYHMKDVDVTTRLEGLVKDAYKIYLLCGEKYNENEDYKLMKRLLGEQTKKEGEKVVIKENKEIAPTSLQNPSDPEATYRRKANKDYTGYTGNVVEVCGERSENLIVDFEFEKNTYSDSEFGKKAIENLGKQEERVALIGDGAFSGEENIEKAEEKNIELITTNLTGKIPNEIESEFEIDEEKKEVKKCPAGERPTECKYNEKDETYSTRFNKEKCEKCPFKEECGIEIKKKVASIRVSKSTVERAKYLKKLKTEEYKNYARMRNGVEGTMSELRRRYGMNEIPVSGFVRSKMWYTLKIGALNVSRMINIKKRRTLMV